MALSFFSLQVSPSALFFSLLLMSFTPKGYSVIDSEKREDIPSDIITAGSTSVTQSIDFDVRTLKSLGYGAEVATFFQQGNLFLPGQHEVTLVINGSTRYPATVSFDKQGQLCFTPLLQKILKLKPIDIKDNCTNINTLYPNAIIIPHPDTFTVDIVVSESDFDPQLRGNLLTYGGFALLSNYRVYGMQIKGTDTQQFYQGQFETGFNWENWVLRNNSNVFVGQHSNQYQFNETTLARSIEQWQAMLQLGQINTEGRLFGGTPLNGAQIYSDKSLNSLNQLVVPITGITETPATVDVIQNSRLLYRTLVPAGSFLLDRVQGMINGQPLQVVVSQEDGQRRQFDVMTSLKEVDTTTSETNYQVALGQYRNGKKNNHVEMPFIVNLEVGRRKAGTDYQVGVQLSKYYQLIGGRIEQQWGELWSTGASFGGRYARSNDKQGQQWDASLNTAFGALSLGISSSYRTREYPTLDKSIQNERGKLQEYETSSLSLSSETQTSSSFFIGMGDTDWGRIGYSLGYTHYYGNKLDSVMHTLSYGKKFGSVFWSINYQASNERDKRVFVNASMPLGSNASVNTQMQCYQDDIALTSTLSHRPSSLWGYSVGISHNKDSDKVNGSLNSTTAYSQLAGSASWSNNQTRAMMASVSGSMVYADGIFATSPITLGDTFGVIRISGQPGVKINTLSGGETMTNAWGTAAIPTLPVGHKTTVQLDTKNLPLNIRLNTTSFDVAVAKGSIIAHEVKATVVRQLLLEIKLADGSPAPSGSSLVDEKGLLLGVVMGNGNVMISNEQIGLPLRLRITNQPECAVRYSVPEQFDAEALYEEVEAYCE